MTLKKEVSEILGIRIENWDKSIASVDVMGGFSRKQLQEIVILLCRRVEQLERPVLETETV